MTNEAAFGAALRMIGEVPGAHDLADYTARAPHLLCMACRALAALDVLWRGTCGYAAQQLPAGSEYPLDAVFPLCDEMLPAAAAHMASGLLFDESPVQSDRCYSRYERTVYDLIAHLPAKVEAIIDRYPG